MRRRRGEFEKAVALDGRNNEAFVGLGNAYAELKQYDKAEATYRKAISLRPGDWVSYKQLGSYFYKRRQYDKAIEQYGRVVELSPDNAQGYLNLGGIQFLREDLTQAEKNWLRALDLDPARGTTAANLAKLYQQREQYPKAIAMYQRALESNQRSHQLWGSLGGAYVQSGDSAKAADPFAKAISLLEGEALVNAQRADLHSNLAFYRAAAGRRDFERPLQRALQLAPEDAGVRIRAAETWMLAGDSVRALASAQAGIARGYSISQVKRSSQLRSLADQLKPQPKP